MCAAGQLKELSEPLSLSLSTSARQKARQKFCRVCAPLPQNRTVTVRSETHVLSHARSFLVRHSPQISKTGITFGAESAGIGDTTVMGKLAKVKLGKGSGVLCVERRTHTTNPIFRKYMEHGVLCGPSHTRIGESEPSPHAINNKYRERLVVAHWETCVTLTLRASSGKLVHRARTGFKSVCRWTRPRASPSATRSLARETRPSCRR